MARSARSSFEKNPLRTRIAALRHRLRFVVTTRGVGWLLAVVLLSGIVAGVLDWAWHFPPLVRGFLLVAMLSAAGLVGLLFLLRPLLDRMDDLTLALRIEERYPSLNDALASTIQFLEMAEKKSLGEDTGSNLKDSLAMRREAVRRAMQKADGCDFNRVVDTRGLRTATVLGGTAVALTALLLCLDPARATTALTRLFDPFGAAAWPSDVVIRLDQYPTRVSRDRSEKFKVSGRLESRKGVLPAAASIYYRHDNATPVKHEVPATGTFADTFDHLGKSFSFQVRAGDAATDWLRVEVAAPPSLIARQVNLFAPEYTGLTPYTMPENNCNVDAVAGTVVKFKGTATVPLRAAWVEYHPELGADRLAAFLSPFGAADPASLLGTLAVGIDLAGRHEATLSEDRRSFHLRFRPHFIGKGSYTVHLVDDTGLSSAPRFDLLLRADPAPVVVLERPTPNREILEVLPSAVLPLLVNVDDPEFGIRSIWLEYRTHPDQPFRRLQLYDPALAMSNPALPLAAPALPFATIRLRPTQHIVEGKLPLSRLRHPNGKELEHGDALTLRALADDFDNVTVDKQPGVSSHVEIKVVSRAALELALNREQERIQKEIVELRQQEREAIRKLGEIENRAAQTKTVSPEDRAELTRLEQVQQQIRERLQAVGQESVRSRVERILETLKENDLRNSAVQSRMESVQRDLDRIGREELEQIEAALAEAQKRAEGVESKNNPGAKALEQLAGKSERQARELEQLAEEKGRDQTDRARLAAEAKQLKEQAKRLRELSEEIAKEKPDAQKRAQELEALAAQRDKLARELEKQAGRDNSGRESDLLRQAREQKEAGRSLRDQARAQAEPGKRERPDAQASLTEARRRQEEVDKTLGEMLERLEPWSTTREVKNEANAILEAQRRLKDEVEAMQQQGLSKNRAELTAEQQARVKTAEDEQRKLRERLEELTEKMRRLAEKRKESDPATAEEMKESLEALQKNDVSSKMKGALDALGPNQLGEAGRQQKEAIAGLEDVVRKMEDRRSAALGRDIEELKKLEKQLEELAAEQDELRKKVKEADQIPDARKRDDELQKLKKEQQKLQEKTQDVARKLGSMKASRAAQTAGHAAKQMEEAVKRLERGEVAPEQQEEAVNRLDEAADEAARERDKTEEELARELMDRVADVIKRIKERHDRLLAETGRLHKEAQERKEWTRLLRLGTGGLADLAESQKLLAEETRTVAERDLGGAEVFSRQLLRAADAMRRAADALNEHLKRVEEEANDLTPPREAERLQLLAQRRLQGLLDALKMDDGEKAKPKPNNQQEKKEGENQQQQQQRRPGDGIPPLAQLKLLRSMQAEVNERTKELSEKKADPQKLTDEEKKELQTLQGEQRAIADLIEEYSRPQKDEGEKK